MSDGMSDSWQSKLERLMGMLGDVDVDPAINDELTHVYRREEYDATEIRMLREQLEIANLMLESRNRLITGISHLETELCNALARAERAEAALAAVRSDEMIERLADQQHAIWSHWMEYLFSCCAEADDGSMLIPVEKVERWQRQMLTPYSNLSESEQKSDIDQAGKIIAVVAPSDNDLLSGEEAE